MELLEIKNIFDTVILADDCIAGKSSPIPCKKALQQIHGNEKMASNCITL
ncbi:hypothetical protein RINTHH_15870 [Richelia intracellularis HH01]|jgi:beta-phosphoglucomutase-like phosphatase (HAD superfamily)|uniref:Uncharacterized protein n=2 Tax=Richelia TaxID=98443 RepID=M1WZN8_9NOST|nr:hypothetical protein RINTHH_15870 [Richelia intracellularis HH01]